MFHRINRKKSWLCGKPFFLVKHLPKKEFDDIMDRFSPNIVINKQSCSITLSFLKKLKIKPEILIEVYATMVENREDDRFNDERAVILRCWESIKEKLERTDNTD